MTRHVSLAGCLAALLVALGAPAARAQNFFDALQKSIQQAQQQQQQQQHQQQQQNKNTQQNPPRSYKYEYRPGKDDYSYGSNQGQGGFNFPQYRQQQYPQGGNYYSQPQQRYAGPQQQGQPQAAQEPVEAKLVPALPNPVQLSVRSATRAEIDAVRKELAGLQDDLVTNLEDSLAGTLPQTAKLLPQLEAKGVATDTQTQLLLAVKAGNADQAQVLWATSMKDAAGADELYRRVAVAQSLKNLRENAGELVGRDVRNLRRALDKVNLDAKTNTAVQHNLQELESSLTLLDGVGNGGDGAAKTIAPPPTTLEVLANPKLAPGTVVELAPGRYMVAAEGKKLALVPMNLAAVAGFLVVEGPALATTEGRETTHGVVLRCLGAAKTPVAYRLVRTAPVYNAEDDETYNQEQAFDYKMAPGEFQYLPQPWRVDFQRGGQFGAASYQLKDGVYEFRPTEKGWELFTLGEFAVTIDNSRNRRPFQFVFNNEPKTVEAGKQQTFKSAYPPVIRYLRGALSAEKVVRLNEGVYRVGLAASDGAWDLFPAQAAAATNVAEGGANSFVPAQ